MSDYICNNNGAKHLRAKIHPPEWRIVELNGGTLGMRRDYYWVDVVNTNTGKVVYRSDAFGFENAVKLADQAVGTTRWAWSMGLKQKDLS